MFCRTNALLSFGLVRRVRSVDPISHGVPTVRAQRRFFGRSQFAYTSPLLSPKLTQLRGLEGLGLHEYEEQTDLFDREEDMLGIDSDLDDLGENREKTVRLEDGADSSASFEVLGESLVDSETEPSAGPSIFPENSFPSERLDPVLNALSEIDSTDLIDDFLGAYQADEGMQRRTQPRSQSSDLSKGALARARQGSHGSETSGADELSLEDLETTSLGEIMKRSR